MKELEDHEWFPPLLRKFQMDFLAFTVIRFGVYEGFIQRLRDSEMPPQPMVDLCSGSGEPAITIFRKSNRFTRLTLTDKFPMKNFIAEGPIEYIPNSLDVLDMQFEPDVCYTMFNAFHHFSDRDKMKIVERVSESGSEGFFVEILEPRVDTMLKVCIATTLGLILVTPFIKPFSWKRLLFTYILPVNIFTITFDGILSVIKSGSAKQYQNLFFRYGKAIEITRLRHWLTSVVIIHIRKQK